MKKIAALLLILSLMTLLAGCGSEKPNPPSASSEPQSGTESTAQPPEQNPGSEPDESRPEKEEPETPGSRILVVYFSRTGNTKALAEYAVTALNADSYEIEAAVPYTDADIAYYTDCRADREQADPAARPEIAGPLPDVGRYDLIVLGYPIWHGKAPRIVSTFLEGCDFTGVTILPFCTSASSGLGGSDTALHELCNAEWKGGKRFPAAGGEQEFAAWLSDNVPRNEETEEENAMGNEITLRVGDRVVPVSWEENPSVAELARAAAEEPIQIAMSPYGGWEQVGTIGRVIVSSDVRQTARNGDIMLYSGDQIVLFYGENTWAYTKLGHIDLPEAEITALLSGGTVRITLAAGQQG